MLIQKLFEAFRSGDKKKPYYRELRELAAGGGPIVFGPFFTEIGFEVLYWIPFINWFKTEFKVSPDRIIAISRGGAQSWYRHIAGRYFDIFNYFTLEEFKNRNEVRIQTNRKSGQKNGPKHLSVSDLDRDILEAVTKANNISDYKVLHPSYMFKFMGVIRNSPELKLTKFDLFQPAGPSEVLTTLPDDYVSVKFWFGGQFRESEETKRFVQNLIRTLSASQNVVLLNTGLPLERHDGFDGWFNQIGFDRRNVFSIAKHLTAQNNLHIQSAVMAGSKMFFGTYGGFAYAAPFLGVPAITFYSHEDGFVYEHLEMLRKALRLLRLGTNRQVDLVPYHIKQANHFSANLHGIDFLKADPA